MPDVNYDELVDQFLSWKRHNKGRSVRTSTAYRLALRRLAEFAAADRADRDPLTLTRDELEIFSGKWLYDRGVGPRGRRPYVAAVREFFKWLYQQRGLERNPAASLEYANVGRVLPKVITLGNAEKLMWAPDFSTFVGVRDGAILGLLAGCGLRVSGLVGMNDVDVIQEVIDKERRLLVRVTEKGSRQRLVPVPREADMLLRVYMDHPQLNEIDRALPDGSKVLFVSVSNRTCSPHEYRGARRRLGRRAVYELIKRYGQREGIPLEQLHPHAMRHLFGTELAEEGIDLQRRQQLLGHLDPKSTEIYTHTAMRGLSRDLDRGNPLGKMNTPVTDLLKRLGKSA